MKCLLPFLSKISSRHEFAETLSHLTTLLLLVMHATLSAHNDLSLLAKTVTCRSNRQSANNEMVDEKGTYHFPIPRGASSRRSLDPTTTRCRVLSSGQMMYRTLMREGRSYEYEP